MNVETCIAALAAGVFLLFCFLCAAKLGAMSFFKAYLASLFYADYLKLVFPSLPLGFVPDLLLGLFLARACVFEPERVRRVFAAKRFFAANLFVGIYLAYNFLEIFNPLSPSPLLGAQTFRGLFKITAVYWAVLFVVDGKKQAFELLKFLMINVFVVFIFSFKQIFFGFSEYELAVYSPGAVRRIYSSVTNAAVFSLVMGVGAVYWYLEAVFKKKPSYMVLAAACLGVSSLSLQRAPLFATFLALLLVSILNFKQAASFFVHHLGKALFLLLLIMTGVTAFFVLPLPLRYSEARNEIVHRLISAKKGLREEGLRVRMKQVPAAIAAVRKYPFGGGLGYTELRFGKRLEDFSFFKGLHQARMKVRMPLGTGDSTFLTVFLETGWLGMGYFLFLLFWALASAFRRLGRAGSDAEGRQLLSFSLAVMLCVALSLVTSSVYFIVLAGSLFWLAFGLVQAAGDREGAWTSR